MASRPYLDPRDHAFANGPVFARPANAAAARAMFDRPEDGERLMHVFEAFERGAELGDGVRLGLEARLLTPDGERRVRIGANAAIRGVIRCEGEGRCEIGPEVYVGDDAIISAWTRIEIGEGTLIAHGAQVFDNDTHPIDAAERRAHFRSILKLGPRRDFTIGARPVRIGRDCWLGFGAAVMKGVSIGDEAIVAAGAVVVSDVRSRTIVAGSPARQVRALGASGRAGLSRLFGGR
ncbi:MAG TPA: acyltransferase [Caulobacteraceae bacterium]|jgi:acetyltransferase-like isoleucine patch superfamily enzyme|nr:acyltransferase [Caulobacteraceae bacterium]